MPTPKECTLLELVWSVNEVTEDEHEAIATVVYLINSGRVRLCGNFAGAKITLSDVSLAVSASEKSHPRSLPAKAFSAQNETS